jgi:acyl dehydratase
MHETLSFEAVECSGRRRLGNAGCPGNTAHALVTDVRHGTKDGELGQGELRQASVRTQVRPGPAVGIKEDNQCRLDVVHVVVANGHRRVYTTGIDPIQATSSQETVMTQFRDLEAIANAQGTDLGISDWHPISQTDVNMFADATDAHEWIHVDPERAQRESPFGRTVAHGYLTMSLATPFVTQLLAVDGPMLGINYGLNRVRFPTSVPVGARVRARGMLKSAQQVGENLRTTVELVYETEGSDRPPCVAEVVSLLLPPG